MSVLFPKVNKPREWDYRPIYYDKEKDERAAKLAQRRAERKEREAASQDGVSASGAKEPYVPTLHRGSFREARAKGGAMRDRTRLTSRLSFWIVLLLFLGLVFWLSANMPMWLKR